VVILYRPGWGETAYTSIEQDAIKSRRVRTTDVRWIVVVAMEPPEVPDWYPRNEFFLTPEWEDASIAAVVAERVRAGGGIVGPESPTEKARRLQQRDAAREALEQRRRAEGPTRLEQEATALFRALASRAEIIDGMAYQENLRSCAVNYGWGSLVVEWHRQYTNSLDGAELAVAILDQNTHFRSYARSREPRVLLSARFEIAVDAGGGWGWRPTRRLHGLGGQGFLRTDELADWALNELIERIHAGPSRSGTASEPFRVI
jgi:hypothetical protein